MKDKYKKFIIISLIVLAFAVLSILYFSGMGLKPEYEWAYHPLACEQPYSDDNEVNFYMDTVRYSTGAVTAEFIKCYIRDDLYVWEFNKKDEVYGNIPENVIKVTRTYLEEDLPGGIDGTSFVSGEEYLLFLYRDTSGEDVSFELLGQVCIPLDNFNASTWERGRITYGYGIKREDILNYYKEMAMEKGYNKRSYRP
ncbi:MAG: hypothetical protein E7564_06470 [Ruminococcaceae bacterium]|nr:hypothetical protein [Oscillospiraceae bacterium]